MTYKLYWGRTTGAFAPEAVLAELGQPFERVELDWRAGATRQADYLAVNPLGQLPALELPDGTVVTESAAISIFLAGRHPEAGLLPPPDDPARGTVLRWTVFAAVNLYEVELSQYLGDEHGVPEACLDQVAAARAAAIDRCWGLVEAALPEPGPYLLGARFSLADVYLAMVAGWQLGNPKMASPRPRVERLVAHVRRRPAIAPLWREHYGHKEIFRD